MQVLDAATVAALATSHDARVRLHALASPTDLTIERTWEEQDGVIVSGTVSLDRGRQVRGSGSLALVDADGDLAPSGIGDTLGPRSAVRVERGVVLPGGTAWLPLATHIIDRPRTSMTGAITLTTASRLSLARQQFGEPETVATGTRVGDVIRGWLSPAVGDAEGLWDIDDGDQELGAVAIVAETDERLDRAVALASDFALEILTDRLGCVVVRPKVDPTAVAAVATLERGETILRHDRELTAKPANRAIAVGEGLVVYRAVAEITDANSPLHPSNLGYTDTVYARSAAITSQYQAEQVARQLLIDQALVEDTAMTELVPDHRLDEGDVVTISEASSGTSGRYRLDRLDLPVTTGSMRITATKVQALA